MKIEKVNTESVNRLFRQTKLQVILSEFMHSEDKAVRIVLDPGEYANARSAQASFYKAIQRLRYPIKARILNGELYLIKVDHYNHGKGVN